MIGISGYRIPRAISRMNFHTIMREMGRLNTPILSLYFKGVYVGSYLKGKMDLARKRLPR